MTFVKYRKRVMACTAASIAVCAIVLVAVIHMRDDSQSDIPAVHNPNMISLPLDAYRRSPGDESARFTALDLSVRSCMKGFGIDYPVPDRAPVPGMESADAREFGLIDLDHARRWGFHESPASVSRTDSILGEANSLPPAEHRVYSVGSMMFGGTKVPTGGCLGQANRTVDTPLPPGLDPQIVNELAGAAFTASTHSRAVVAAVAAWSSCMRAKGLSYPDPFAAGGDTKWALDRPAVSAAEISTAVADVQCNYRTNLAGISMNTDAALERELIAAHMAELATVGQWLAACHANVERVLAQSA